jgi:hypothetical protein
MKNQISSDGVLDPDFLLSKFGEGEISSMTYGDITPLGLLR